MAKIIVLNEETANRIAAGEVVDRPAGVLRELMENALDAGANSIVVTLANGGKTLLSVTDDGCGLSPDDALLALERHATSKIKNVEDIFRINTLGFRGEALPAIASVSRFTMVTRALGMDDAVKVVVEGGRVVDNSRTSAPGGTTITVEKLFFNTPARRSFLKSAQVEMRHLLEVFHIYALLKPEVYFRLTVDGKEKLVYPAERDLDKRFHQVFGSDFSSLPFFTIDHRREGYHLYGRLCAAAADRPMLSDFQYTFVNGRRVRDRILNHALRAALEPFHRLEREFRSGKLTPHILYLELPPELVDVNVHPAKAEIRFRDAQAMHSFVLNAVQQAMTADEEKRFANLKPAVAMPEHPAQQWPVNSSRPAPEYTYHRPEPVRPNTAQEMEMVYQPEFFAPATPVVTAAQHPVEEDLVNPWQLHNTYILVQVSEGVMVIDQHAAHERIMYEKMQTRLEGGQADRQRLLFPLAVEMPPYMAQLLGELIEQNLHLFERLGFGLKVFSGRTLVVEEIPVDLPVWDDREVLLEMLRQLQLEYEQTPDFRLNLAKAVACKAAIKAGDPLDKASMLNLINDLFACKNPYHCPHGRPLIFKITLEELEKRFKRLL